MRTLTAACCSAATCVSVAASPGEPPYYTIVRLGSLSNGNCVAMGISDPTPVGPVVVGNSFSTFTPPTLSWRAVAWRPDVSLAPKDLLTFAQAGNSTLARAQDVSPNGAYIVGGSSYIPGGGTRWLFDPVTGQVTGIQALSGLPGDGSEGIAVNSAGRAAGYSMTDSSNTRGVTWAPGNSTAVLLPTPAGSGGLRMAREISEPPLEHIVGRCDMSSTPTTRPIIWKKSVGVYQMGQIADLVGPAEVHDAMGISPDGTTMVGFGALPGGQAAGIAWDSTTNDATAYTPICCAQNVVYDMNNHGVAVGYTALNFQMFRAIIWWEGQPYDLSSRIINDPEIGDNLFLQVATGINNAGQIVGMISGLGAEEPLSPGTAYILTPVVRQVPSDLTGDGVVDGADLGTLLGAWGSCANCGACAADFTGDCVVDGADLGVLLGDWTI